MARITSAWTALAAALVVSLAFGGAGSFDDDAGPYGAGIPAASSGDAVADAITVRATRMADGKAIEVVAELVLPLDRDVVWAVLNDYEAMPRFVPDILSTRLVSAAPGKKRVEIEGVARLLFLAFPTHTTLDVGHQSDGSIILSSVAGNLGITGVVRVHGDKPTRVDYRVRITPDFWLPPLIGDFLIGRHIERQFEGMVAEMHRRAGGQQREGASGMD